MNPAYAVNLGDRIKEVNGFRAADGVAKLQQELRGNGKLRITVARDANAEEAQLMQAAAENAVLEDEASSAASTAVPSPEPAYTFTVHMDKSGGGKLGMGLEVETLAVNSVTD